MRKFINIFLHANLVLVGVYFYSNTNSSVVSTNAMISCDQTKNVSNVIIQYDCDNGKLVTQKNTNEPITMVVRNSLFAILKQTEITQTKQQIPVPKDSLINVSIVAKQ
jgi:hypothetical protein